MAAAGIQVRRGREWSADKSLEVAESRLRHKVLVGPIATGCAGLGYFPVTRVDNAQGKVSQHLVQEEVRAGVEEVRASRMVGMGQQEAWTKWENVQQHKITWADIWKADFHRLGS